MINHNLLQSKCNLALAEHRRELSTLNQCRDREVKMLERVRDGERRFWSEILRGTTSQIGGDCIASAMSGPSAIAFAFDAHRVLKHVKEAHRLSALASERQVARVIRSKVEVGAYESLAERARARHNIVREERHGEELSELLAARLSKYLTPRGLRQEKKEESHSPGQIDRDVLDVTLAPSLVARSSPFPHGEVCPKGFHDGLMNNRATTSCVDGVQISSVNLESSERGHSLHLSAESCAVPLTCRITAPPQGSMSVLVTAPHSSLVESLASFRGALRAKLREVGIVVSSVEVRHDSSPIATSPSEGSLRKVRRLRGGDDEDDNS